MAAPELSMQLSIVCDEGQFSNGASEWQKAMYLQLYHRGNILDMQYP
jgi:hypothetical protein